MAKRKKSARKDRGGKRTRFHLSRKGETALAWAGGVILIIAVALLAFWARARFFAPDTGEARRLDAINQKDAAICQGLIAGRVILSEKPAHDNLIVDRDRWLAKPVTEREQDAGALSRHFGQKSLFLLDGSGATVGWYQEGAGYKEPSAKPQG